MTTTAVMVDMDRRCSKCGAEGTTPSGLCLACAGKIILSRLTEERLMDSVLLVDQKDPARLYQQAKAVEAQRALLDLKGMTEDEDDEVMSQVKKSLAQVHSLVGLLLCSRLTVRKPVAPPQGNLEFSGAADEGTGVAAADEVVRKMNVRRPGMPDVRFDRTDGFVEGEAS